VYHRCVYGQLCSSMSELWRSAAYTEPDFDPTSVSRDVLRSILGYHGVQAPGNAKKVRRRPTPLPAHTCIHTCVYMRTCAANSMRAQGAVAPSACLGTRQAGVPPTHTRVRTHLCFSLCACGGRGRPIWWPCSRHRWCRSCGHRRPGETSSPAPCRPRQRQRMRPSLSLHKRTCAAPAVAAAEARRRLRQTPTAAQQQQQQRQPQPQPRQQRQRLARPSPPRATKSQFKSRVTGAPMCSRYARTRKDLLGSSANVISLCKR
jgi:hypothetical protein